MLLERVQEFIKKHIDLLENENLDELYCLLCYDQKTMCNDFIRIDISLQPSDVTKILMDSGIEVIDYVKHIYPSMFFDTNLKDQNLVIPEHIETVQQIAYMCSNIKSVVINDNIKKIADGAFSHCPYLASVKLLSKNVDRLYDCVFSDNPNLEEIYLPETITEVSSCLFENCHKLTTINFAGTRAQWNAISKSRTWRVHSSIVEIKCKDGVIQMAPVK